MNTPLPDPSPLALLREVDTRMAQALENFFQRSRDAIEATISRSIVERMTPSALATGQTCLDWLISRPEAMSTAFADQFRLHLMKPETFAARAKAGAGELQLVDDATFDRQLTEEKISAQLTDTLRADVLLLAGRMHPIREAALESSDAAEAYGPLAVVRALSRALDTLGLEPEYGTALLQAAASPLLSTLKHTYAALNQFLAAQNLPEPAMPAPAPRMRQPVPDPGTDVLAYLRSATGSNVSAGAGNGDSGYGNTAPGGIALAHAGGGVLRYGDARPVPLADNLAGWDQLPALRAAQTGGPVLVLRQLQQEARGQATPAFDLAVLDAVAALFEFILDDPDVSPHYKVQIALLQIPALRVALMEPDFFSDALHPARRVIDLMGEFSRRFPERSPSHPAALAQIEQASTSILARTDDPRAAFEPAHEQLAAWLEGEDARTDAALADEVAHLEEIERQELGTLLALENLHDLTERYPAPEPVLRRLEAAWVPYMASLYVIEAGEGPEWRAACLTLLQLFQSLQPPGDEATRESRLQSIPRVNTELRRGLMAQGAEPNHLRDFFGAITAAQECWIRPDMGRQETQSDAYSPSPPSFRNIAPSPEPAADSALEEAQALLEGDWVDFEPPYEGLSTARVAWVGVHGYLLFCDCQGEQRFSIDCPQLAAEIRAGRAHVPEQSLTRKAMLRLRTTLSA